MKKIVIVYAIMTIGILFVGEQILRLPYLLKTLIKLPLFLIFPLLIMKFNFQQNLPLKMDRRSIVATILLSILVFSIIVLAYFTLQAFIDVEGIRNDIKNRMMLSKNIIVYAGFYTIFMNSFIEEVFFRGFIFQNLLASNNKYFSYGFSAGIFAIYHIAIFKTWFSITMTLLILLGLFVGGLIFSYFVEKTKSIICSWAIHIAADLAIVYIGFKYLDLIF